MADTGVLPPTLVLQVAAQTLRVGRPAVMVARRKAFSEAMNTFDAAVIDIW
ncbi:hypothetical protein ACFYZB_42370 [Streptomyces sp. NPDC001852]|uniref:hypothetical protein n=1 Tax=Streptomyces sp. NPDC001852 TaxID=3364619 RepID=UPI0036ABD2FE